MELRCPYCMGLLPPGDRTCPSCGRKPDTYRPPANQLPPGTILHKRYQLGRALGAGGFGITYLAWDSVLDRRVAVKEYFPTSMICRVSASNLDVSRNMNVQESDYQKGKGSFLQEARTLSHMGNIPGIVQAYDFFEAHNTAYLVMEYLEGETFAQLIQRRGRLSMGELLKLLKPVFDALEEVHRAGMIHRDISPDNLMVLKNGTAKVMDFGAAREIDGGRTMTKILRDGYAPREQYTGHNQGPWTDIYALCGVIYYCLSGQVPPRALERYDGNDSLRPPHTLGAAISAEQEAALLKGLAIKPEDRWKSVSDLYNTLEAKPAHRKTDKYPEKPVAGESTVLLDNGGSNSRGNGGNNHKGTSKIFKISAVVALILGLFVSLFVYFHLWENHSFPGNENPDLPDFELPDNENPYPWRDNVLMEDLEEGRDLWDYSDYPVFGSDITRKEIFSVTFLDTTANAPQGAWDVSQAKNRSVLAWTEEAGGSLYNLYIAGNGGVAAPSVSAFLFARYSELKEIRFNSALHTESVTIMFCMFMGCSNLTTLDVSDFDTSNVIDMGFMFDYCSNLRVLDVNGFDTSNVTNMDGMFWGCYSLKTLDVSGFNTSNVTHMGSMFFSCDSLTELDVSGFDTSKVTNMDLMFCNCENLTELDVSGFDTSNVTNMKNMFGGCKCVTVLNVSGFDTSNVTNMFGMFSSCNNLTIIYASNHFVTNQLVHDAYDMFADGYIGCFDNCISLIGGNGTAYSEAHTSAEYARIDTPGQPGYFTAKE